MAQTLLPSFPLCKSEQKGKAEALLKKKGYLKEAS